MLNGAKVSHSLNVRQMVVFSMLGTLMFCSKIIMEAFPNIHLLGMLTITYTAVFRAKALIPIYIYVILNGIYAGFSLWWIPYIYIWTVLWAITMLVPKNLPDKHRSVIYPLLCGFHGFAFGTLYAPAQALMFGFTLKQTVAWIIAGLPFDVIHGISNLVVGLLALPFSKLISRLMKKSPT